jgi:hypothetical protein
MLSVVASSKSHFQAELWYLTMKKFTAAILSQLLEKCLKVLKLKVDV